MPPPVPVCDWILTTAGIAWLTALITADDSSMCTCETFVPSGVWFVVVPFSSASRVVTAAADSEPETIPPPRRGPRRRHPPRDGAQAEPGWRRPAGAWTRVDALRGCGLRWMLYGEGAALRRWRSEPSHLDLLSVGASPVRGGVGFSSVMMLAFFWLRGRKGYHRDAARLRAAACGREVS